MAGFLKNDAAKVTDQLILVWGVNFSTETIVIGKVVEIRLVFGELENVRLCTGSVTRMNWCFHRQIRLVS